MRLEKRKLGFTGFNATVLGIGDLADRSLPLAKCVATIYWGMTIGPDVALLGLSFPNEQDAAFKALGNFRPLKPAEMEETRRRAAHAIEGKGPCWWDPAS